MKRALISSWALAVLLFFPATSLAGTPTAYVKGILNKVMAIQNDPALAGEAHKTARAQAITQVIKANFDFPLMACDSLGPTYDQLTPGQRQEFQTTFSRLFQDSYTRLVLNFLKQENIDYQQESTKNNQAQVKTTIVRINESIPVEYLMHRHSKGWILYDVLVDGVSILDNYKRKFARVVQTKSFAYLLNRMKLQAKAIE
jgi:phospholipid transport system substrate-binding protein